MRDQILSLQLSFVERVLGQYSLDHINPVMRDLIRIHDSYNRSLYAGPCPVQDTSMESSSILDLSPGTLFLILDYHPDALQMIGEYNLEEFFQSFRPARTPTIVYNCRGEVKNLAVDEEIFNYIKGINGTRTLIEILSDFADDTEMTEIIDYALHEKIVYIMN